MANNLEELERVLGGKIEQLGERSVPGLVPVSGVGVVYYQDDKRMPPKKLFKSFLDGLSVRSAKSGGRVSDTCSILSPDGLLFRAMSYHGDLAGWGRDIEEGAKGLGLLLAYIEVDKFIISDGRSYPLSECKIKFT